MAAIERVNDVFNRSYRRSWLVFGYGVVWFVVLIAGYPLTGALFAPGNPIGTILPAAAVASALAGGIGGVTAMFQRMAHHLTVEQDFHEQSLFSYLLQPLTGLIAGVLSLFLVTLPGTLLLTYAATQTFSLANVAASSTFAALQLLLAWVAGYSVQNWLAKARRDDNIPSTSKALVESSPQPGPPPDATRSAGGSLSATKAWVAQRRRMLRWSVTWGVFILIYGLIWLVALLAALLEGGSLFPAETGDNLPLVNLLAAGWPAILAGGVGGVIGMLYDLYRRISFARDFDLHYTSAYLILPLTGLVLGGVIYLFIGSGYLSFQSLIAEAPPVIDAPRVIAAYLVLGWIAGFRPRSILGLIERLIQSVTGLFRFSISRASLKAFWDKTARADAFSEISQQTELFKPLDRNRT